MILKMLDSFQIKKSTLFFETIQTFLKNFVHYSIIFAILKTTESTTELDTKHQKNLFFKINSTEKLIQSATNHHTLRPSDIQLPESEETRFLLTRSIPLVREIYESGHSVPLPHKCPNRGSKLKLFVPILSDPWHYAARKAIRETWGIYGKRKDVEILFFLGSTTDAYLEIKLTHEQKIFNDIVRCNIFDSYTNLTLKTISILEWVDKYCSEAKYVLKTDDDVFINMPRLLTFVRVRLKLRDVIFGNVSPHNKPHRNKEDKYYVPVSQYELKEYPPFLTGPAYLISGDIVHRLYEESLKTAFLKLEDVFLTGIVAEKLGIQRIDRPEFVNQRIPFNVCELQRSISLHSIKLSEQYDLWERLFDCNLNCPYFCIHKSSSAALVENNFILFATAAFTASLIL